MNWMTRRPILSGFYWFEGTVCFTSSTHEIIVATVVKLTGLVPNLKVWFPQKDMPIPISECDGRWAGPLEVPR